jgi:HSP20 family protein
MTLTTRWRNNNGLGLAFRPPSFQDDVNQLLQTFSGAFDIPSQWSPAVDLYESNDVVTVKVEVPGMKKEEIEITLRDGTLVLKGEHKETSAAEKNPSHRTRQFERAINLPYQVNAAAIKASYVDGILTVELPKAEEAKPKKINVEFN